MEQWPHCTTQEHALCDGFIPAAIGNTFPALQLEVDPLHTYTHTGTQQK